MNTIIKKLALYVSITATAFLAATALIPTAQAATTSTQADVIQASLNDVCQKSFRLGDTEFLGSDCKDFAFIAINTKRKQAVVIEPSTDFMSGIEKLSSTGLKSDYNEKTKILALDGNTIDVNAVAEIYKSNGMPLPVADEKKSQTGSGFAHISQSAEVETVVADQQQAAFFSAGEPK